MIIVIQCAAENIKKTAMDNLLREGAVSYLDALFALHRFQRMVTDIAVEVLKARLPEFASAVGIQGLRSDDVWPYYNPSGAENEWDGNWAWLTARIWVPEPWSGRCHLGLRFDRGEDENSTARVTFMCGEGRVAVFTKLKSAFQDREFYFTDVDSRECGFHWKLENPTAVQNEFQKMMDYVVSVWSQLGGWNRL